MENASKALLIAGAILLAILIIAIGMFIYNSAQSTVNDSITTMSTQEVDAFNNQFVSYEGTQTGSNVKALIGRLIANANTYTEEPGKVPDVTVTANGLTANQANAGGNAIMSSAGANNVQTYVDELGNFRNVIESKHEYYITFSFGASGIIDNVEIEYNPPTN